MHPGSRKLNSMNVSEKNSRRGFSSQEVRTTEGFKKSTPGTKNEGKLPLR